MIRKKCTYSEKEKNVPIIVTETMYFSDDPIVALTGTRFIGQGGSSEEFLSVARIIGSNLMISKMTFTLKQASQSFGSVVFQIIRTACPNGEVKLDESTVVFSGKITWENITGRQTAFYKTESFTPTLISEGDLIAIKIIPETERMSFYAAVTLC